jgi:hypothetical protein
LNIKISELDLNDEILFIAIDATLSRSLPHFVPLVKRCERKHLLELVISGCLTFGHQTCRDLFFSLAHNKKDSNFTIAIIKHVVLRRLSTGKRPRLIRIQLDNTSKENKNR